MWGIPSPRKAPSIYGTIWDILRQNASFFVLTYCSKQVTLQAITSLSMVSMVQEELKKKKEEAEKVQEELKRRKSCPKPPTSPASAHQPSQPPDSVLLLEVWLKKTLLTPLVKRNMGLNPPSMAVAGLPPRQDLEEAEKQTRAAREERRSPRRRSRSKQARSQYDLGLGPMEGNPTIWQGENAGVFV